MTEQFEQAKREFAVEFTEKMTAFASEMTEEGFDNLVRYNTDKINALLEQHKEMMLREELIKFGDYFNECVSKTIYTSLIDEYLKNVKK